MKRFDIDEFGNVRRSTCGEFCFAQDAVDARVTAIVAGIIVAVIMLGAGFVFGAYASMLGYL